MAQTGGIKGYLEDLKKSKLAIPFSLVLTVLVGYLLLIIGSVLLCLLPVAIAVVIYFVPRYFGLVNRKKLLIAGTVIILVLGIASGLTYYSILKDEAPVTLHTTDNVLSGGNITPFRGTDSTNFTFSVIYTGTNTTPHIFVTVSNHYRANALSIYDLANDANYTGPGDRYVLHQTFASSIYYFEYSYEKPDGSFVHTETSWGPYTMTNDQIFGSELRAVPLAMFLNVGPLFYLLVLLFWWMERSKKRFEEQGGRLPGKTAPKTTEKFVCSECGGDVPADADRCPQCGERFEEDSKPASTVTEPKKSEFICSDCGKTVKETDTQCWNCGKKFED
jgi:DNA-directed RNA polymerase subunit RPC12/RpoP